jgi:hypothetical protein
MTVDFGTGAAEGLWEGLCVPIIEHHTVTVLQEQFPLVEILDASELSAKCR